MDRSDDNSDGAGDRQPTVRTEPRFSSRISDKHLAFLTDARDVPSNAALTAHEQRVIYLAADAAYTVAPVRRPRAAQPLNLAPVVLNVAAVEASNSRIEPSHHSGSQLANSAPPPAVVRPLATLAFEPAVIPAAPAFSSARLHAGAILPSAAEPAPLPLEFGQRLSDFTAKALRLAAYSAAGWLALVLALIALYRFVNPPMSSLMLQQRLFGGDVMQDWVAMEAISPQIVRAVLLSEDGRFCQHNGVDFFAMQSAIEHAGDGPPRGASTISMQVTKNLFLWPSKSYVRKAIEIPLTYAIELIWSKRRIMEVYLNIAEWGPGIFGVEAASRFHFDKAASRLNEREAAQLAVALPNPYARDPGDPGPRTQRLAGDIRGRMRGAPLSQTDCVLRPRLAR